MGTKTFLNLAVNDLERSKAFFSRLGFTFNPRFTDENAACMIINEHSYVMQLVERFLRTFTCKKPANTAAEVEMIMAVSADSRQAVDDLARMAFDAGATKSRPPEDHRFMYRFMDKSAASKD